MACQYCQRLIQGMRACGKVRSFHQQAQWALEAYTQGAKGRHTSRAYMGELNAQRNRTCEEDQAMRRS